MTEACDLKKKKKIFCVLIVKELLLFFIIIISSYPVKLNKKTTEKIHCSMFLMVDVALIYVAMWRNEEWSTKSQTFRQLVII